MRPPENDEGRPPARRAATNVEITTDDTTSVRHAPGNVTTLRRYPTAYASLYAPCGRRTCWWCAYLCPYCGGGHFARLKSEDNARGVRRSGCGRMVWLVPARVYRGRQVEAVSA